MAKTGPTYVPIGPGRRAAGLPEIERWPEGSSQTFGIGMPALISGGYADAAGADPAAIYGFFTTPGNNSASDGVDNAFIDVAKPGKEFVGSLNATLTQAMLGSVAQISVSGSTAYLDTAAGSSSIGQVIIKKPALGYSIGDIKPLVVFTLLADKIQDMNSNT